SSNGTDISSSKVTHNQPHNYIYTQQEAFRRDHMRCHWDHGHTHRVKSKSENSLLVYPAKLSSVYLSSTCVDLVVVTCEP
ncbi:unnamed protein product, partial [Allacma fusca]